MHLQEKTIGSETTYLRKVFYVTKDTARLEDGKAVQRDVVHHSGGVCVVPLTEKGTVLMVKQFRYPMQQVTLEVPAVGAACRQAGKRRRSGRLRQTGTPGRGRTHLRQIYVSGKTLPDAGI